MGGAQYACGGDCIIALFVALDVSAIGFRGVEVWQKDRAIIPLRILKNKNILGGAWYGICMGAAIFVFTYYLPIWFQAMKVSASRSGIMNLPSVHGLVILSIIGSGLVSAL